MKPILLKAFFLSLIITGCSRIPENYTRYSTNEFVIYYPVDWSADKGDTDVQVIFSIPQPIEGIEKLKASVTVSSGSNSSDSDILNDSADILKKSIPEYTELIREKKIFPSKKGHLVFSGKVGNFTAVWDMTFFRGKKDFIVSGICDKSEYEAMKSEFKKIADSFRFK